jgi:hypothetical protein
MPKRLEHLDLTWSSFEFPDDQYLRRLVKGLVISQGNSLQSFKIGDHSLPDDRVDDWYFSANCRLYELSKLQTIHIAGLGLRQSWSQEAYENLLGGPNLQEFIWEISPRDLLTFNWNWLDGALEYCSRSKISGTNIRLILVGGTPWRVRCSAREASNLTTGTCYTRFATDCPLCAGKGINDDEYYWESQEDGHLIKVCHNFSDRENFGFAFVIERVEVLPDVDED